MNSLLDNAKIYNTNKWEEDVNLRRKLNDNELSTFTSAEIRENDYGKAVCFHLREAGKCIFVPLSSESSRIVGEDIELNDIQVITLKKTGEKDIIRIMC